MRYLKKIILIYKNPLEFFNHGEITLMNNLAEKTNMSNTEISMGFVKFFMLKKKRKYYFRYSNSLGVKLALFIGLTRYIFYTFVQNILCVCKLLLFLLQFVEVAEAHFSEKGMQHLKMSSSSC